MKKLNLLTSSPIAINNNPSFSLNVHGPKLAYAFVAIYVIASLVYGFMSNSPWDDDCVTRYYHTRAAIEDPSMFFSLWNRPLFVLLFFPVAQIGPWALMLQMIAITAIAGYYLYKAVEKLQFGFAPLVLPLFFFQTYFFSVSRNNLTEPLAVAIICLGLYFLVNKKYLWFAVVGSLLPLARLELSVLLAIWGLILLIEKQWKYILILAVPTLLLNVLGSFYNDGNMMWLVESTLGKEGEENRYGHTGFWHYFERYIFVTGPIVFYFLFIGLIERISKLKIDLFVFVQFVLGFMLYVVFSWKLNMGNAAGFLRNLIPLTPLTAVLALYGFNHWAKAFIPATLETSGAEAESVSINETVPQPAKEHRYKKKTRKQRNEEAEKKKEKERKAMTIKKAKKGHMRETISVYLLSIAAVVVTYLFYSHSIEMHHKLMDDVNYTHLYIIGGCTVLLIVLTLFKRPLANKIWPPIALGILLLTGTGAYTMISEPPDAHMSSERSALNQLGDIYMSGYLKDEEPLYANHLWFFWTTGLNYPDDEKYNALTMANLDSAPAHSLAIWESHYSNRIFGDVNASFIDGHKDYVELCRIITPDNKFNVALFQKLGEGETTLDLQNRFIEAYPNELFGYASRANTYKNLKQYDKAFADLDKALSIDSNFRFINFTKGLIYYEMKDFEKSAANFKKVADALPKYYQAHYNVATTLIASKQFKESIPYLEHVIETKKDYWAAYEQLGSVYFTLKDYSKAISYYNQLASAQPNNPNCYFNRANCLFQQKRFKEAAEDYDRCIKINPKNGIAYYNKALALANMNDKDGACQMMQEAYKNGYQKAQFALLNCR